MVQYKSKVRSIDLKAMSTIYLDEVKQEYEHKLNNLEKQLKSELSNQKDDLEKEIVSIIYSRNKTKTIFSPIDLKLTFYALK